MPYIKIEDRVPYNEAIKTLPRMRSSSELKHVISEICAWYIVHRTKNYQHMNDVAGVLDCSAREFKRRVADFLDIEECEVRVTPPIGAEESKRFEKFLDLMDSISSAGELNYVVSEVCARYVLRSAHVNLQRMFAKDVLETLEEISKDFYQETAEPYEDVKIKENGDTPGYAELAAQFLQETQ